MVSLGSQLQNFDEATFLNILQSYLDSPKANNKTQIFPIYKSDKGSIRFYLPYNLDWNEKGHDFTKKYFETDSSNFFRIIDFGNNFNLKKNSESINVVSENKELDFDSEVYSLVDEMPIFQGGLEDLLKYTSSIIYPENAKSKGIQGTVHVKFVIDKNGKVTRAEVAKSVDSILDKAALEHVVNMPNWTAGKHKGKYVNVQYVVPIRFRLN